MPSRVCYFWSRYIVFRWAQVTGSPDAPVLGNLNGWRVQYPFDGEMNEGADLSQGKEASESPLLTHFESSDPSLDAVWELNKYTMTAASLDINTDSNTYCPFESFLVLGMRWVLWSFGGKYVHVVCRYILFF